MLKRQPEEEEAEEGALPTVASKFPHCLIDNSLLVRLFMASSMKRSVRLLRCEIIVIIITNKQRRVIALETIDVTL